MKFLQENKYILIFLAGQTFGGYMYSLYFMPKEIESRAKELNLMRYDSKKDIFVTKDSIIFDSDMLDYLKYGSTK